MASKSPQPTFIRASFTRPTTEGLVEVDSRGLRHAAPDVAAHLQQRAPVQRNEYYFRTAMRFTTSSPVLAYLNRLIAVSLGERLTHCVNLDVFQVT